MNDTSKDIADRVAARHQLMSPAERMQIASDLFETARAIVDSSLSKSLSLRDRRLAWAKRFYGHELPQAALEAYANHQGAAES